MSRAIPLIALAAAALVSGGCRLTPQKTPTPAAEIKTADLLRTPAPPDQRFYVMLFGSQDRTRRPAYTHTWATLVRATDRPGGEPALEVHTISWLPAKLDIDAFSRHVEPGVNVELHATIANSYRTGQEIAMWGPFEIWYGTAYRFIAQKQFLETGAVGYQCIDGIGEARRTGAGCDCIHAITDMDPRFPRWRYPLAFYGIPATANVVYRLMHTPVTIGAPATHDWLVPRLGLDRYPIDRREYRGRVNPFSYEAVERLAAWNDREPPRTSLGR